MVQDSSASSNGIGCTLTETNLAKGTIGTAAGKQERSRIETQDPRFETDQ
ncbi:hypothetical protein [Bradyrhizobium zhanjiangense]|nr:hypothetical protein [Bradyrhizobium zhanjiangense]